MNFTNQQTTDTDYIIIAAMFWWFLLWAVNQLSLKEPRVMIFMYLGDDNTTNADDLMIVPQVDWALNTRWDADFPDLDYADENKVIFHGDYGLFVYDLSASKIVTSMDLKEIGCQKIQNEGSSTMLHNRRSYV